VYVEGMFDICLPQFVTVCICSWWVYSSFLAACHYITWQTNPFVHSWLTVDRLCIMWIQGGIKNGSFPAELSVKKVSKYFTVTCCVSFHRDFITDLQLIL